MSNPRQTLTHSSSCHPSSVDGKQNDSHVSGEKHAMWLAVDLKCQYPFAGIADLAFKISCIFFNPLATHPVCHEKWMGSE